MAIFFFILGMAALFRLAAAFLPEFTIDMNNWIAWSHLLVNEGPAKFYQLPVWTDYTPGFLYYLWGMGSLLKTLGGTISPFWVKLPVILADLLAGTLIYQVLKSKNRKMATLGFLGYVFNPVFIFTDSVWGQTDGLLALTLLLSAFFIAQKNNLRFAWFFAAVALLIKPQALVYFPVLIIFTFQKYSYRGVLRGLAIAIITLLALGYPFFVHDPLFGLAKLVTKMSNESPFTSVMAFNFWALATGMWKPDNGIFLGISFYRWGFILLFLAILMIIGKMLKKPLSAQNFYHALGLSYLAFFLFATRIHERYLLVTLPFLLLTSFLSGSHLQKGVFVFISLLALINVYYPYAYYTPESFLSQRGLMETIGTFIPVLSFTLIVCFFLALSRRFDKEKISLKLSEKEKEPLIIYRHWPILLAAILFFAFMARFWQLDSPANFYFDEVYHAFTAREMLRGNPAAWEWWNTPPEGFAYEWTHPPLAKLGMVLGMKLLGENALGWRFPGALLGGLTVLLVFLIAFRLFASPMMGVMAAAVFSLDGLPLVMSRIGMNDSYFLFFVLLAIYLFIVNRMVFSAVALGLALAAKWSTIWAIPILFTTHFFLKKITNIGYLAFFIITPLIYLGSYLPMFVSNHSWEQFVEVQKQMWWYHTRLQATHPFTSPWYSWPLLIRPVWLYTRGVEGGEIANIYAMGNPFVFWTGVAAILVSFWLLFRGQVSRLRSLILVIFSYFVFFTPWAFSPRIMFLYHYLPSLPFLAIGSGYVLRKFPSLIAPFFILGILTFLYFYPHWVGISVPVGMDNSYYWLKSWR